MQQKFFIRLQYKQRIMNYTAVITWEKNIEDDFEKGEYSRVHKWSFDGGMQIKASSSPSVVPLPFSDAALIDPEEAFLASLSSCHMLFFLSIAAKRKIVVEKYQDHVQGTMGKDKEGKIAMLTVTLNPSVIFAGEEDPSSEIINEIHEQAHESCFIASSVKTKIEIVPKF